MDPVIVIQNEEPELEESNDAPGIDLAFMLGELSATVETLTSRLTALEAATAVAESTAEVALDVARDASQDAADAAQDAAETLDVLADALAEPEPTDVEFMAPLVLDDPVPDVPAEKPHPLFRSWAEWKES